MKKIFLTAILVSVSISASAQFFCGLAFDVKWRKDGALYNSGKTSLVDNAYSGEISPQIGYQFNPKLMAGGRINILFDKTYSTEENDQNEQKSKYVMSSIGWDIAPFCRYRLAVLGKNDRFSLWADLHTFFGIKYPRNVQEAGYITKQFNRMYIYGIQAMPTIGFKIKETTTAFINFAIVSLAYSGSSTIYDDRTEYENNVVLFSGKLSGLFTTMGTEGMYGIKFGIIRSF